MNLSHPRRKICSVNWRLRQAQMIATALKSPRHPILAYVIPIRRCNLSCIYCNEYGSFSKPAPTAQMLRRIDQLAALGTTVITLSSGSPLLHPELDEIIRRIRSHGILIYLTLAPVWIFNFCKLFLAILYHYNKPRQTKEAFGTTRIYGV